MELLANARHSILRIISFAGSKVDRINAICLTLSMNPIVPPTRRSFIKTTTKIAAVSALAGLKIPFVHAAEDNTIRVVLVGCGGRGTGAADNALSVTGPPVKLVAMADVFENRLKGSYDALKRSHQDRVDVPEDRKFIGFDGYKHAMDTLKPGDVAIFTTPLAFRWVHFRLRDREGAQRLHGKAGDRGRSERQEDV